MRYIIADFSQLCDRLAVFVLFRGESWSVKFTDTNVLERGHTGWCWGGVGHEIHRVGWGMKSTSCMSCQFHDFHHMYLMTHPPVDSITQPPHPQHAYVFHDPPHPHPVDFMTHSPS